MATLAEELPGSVPRTRAAKLSRALARGPLHVVLVGLALFWTTPTIGLLVTSFRGREFNASTGWWTALINPSQLTLENYRAILDDDRIVGALINTVLITVPTTLLVV